VENEGLVGCGRGELRRAAIEACRRSGFEPRTRASSVIHDAWEGVVQSKRCVGLAVRTAVQAAHHDLRLLALREPLTVPLDLVWRDPTGTPRPPLVAPRERRLVSRLSGRPPPAAPAS
jgi:hypothetical protein